MAGGLPIHLAALRPRMIELAAELGDGVILNLFPRQALPRIVDTWRAARACRQGSRAGQDGLVPGRGRGYRGGADCYVVFASYYAAPVYNEFLAWAGYRRASQEIREGWAAGDRERTAAVGDQLSAIAIIGTREQCRHACARLARGGIHTHVVSCTGRRPAGRGGNLPGVCPDALGCRGP